MLEILHFLIDIQGIFVYRRNATSANVSDTDFKFYVNDTGLGSMG